MARTRVVLDRGGMSQILKSAEVASAVHDRADRVAAILTGTVQTHTGPAPIGVVHYTTDRAAASVAIEHAAGLGTEAKYGHFARAAAASGLEVRAW